MIIERLQIHGFGRIKDQDITLSAPVTVLAGPNEAGKSTVLQFVRAMLFGIPSRTYPAERYEPAAGGAHGGILTARDSEGSRWVISRFAQGQESGAPGTRGERLSITRTSVLGTAEHLTQGDLEKELLGGMSREMFRQLFAISLSELQEIRTLQSDEMSSYLFHAGIGGGGDIVQTERKLAQEMEKLYKPRGRVQESAKVLQSIEILEKKISESRSYLKRYNDNLTWLSEAEEQIAKDEQLKLTLADKLTLLRKAQEIRPLWLQWREAELERIDLPDVHIFPENGTRRWELLQEQWDRTVLRLRELQRITSELKEQCEVLKPDESILSQGTLIERLMSRREYMEARLKELQEIAGEEAALKQQLSRLLRQINPEWGIPKLREFSGAASEREAVRRFASGFGGYDRRMEGLGQERQQAARKLETAEYDYRRSTNRLEEETEAGKSRFSMIIPRSKQETLSIWNDLQSEAEHWRENRLQRVSMEQHENNEAMMRTRLKGIYSKFLWGSCAMTLILPAVLWLSSGSIWGAVSAGLVFLVADAFLLINTNRKSGIQRAGQRRQYATMNDWNEDGRRMTKLMRDLIAHPLTAAAADKTDKNRGEHAANVLEMESSLRELRKLMEAWQSWQISIDGSRAETEALRRRVETLSGDMKSITEMMAKEQAVFKELEDDWMEWLMRRTLESHLFPESVMDMFGIAEQGIEILLHLDKIAYKQASLTQECQEYEHQCNALIPEKERAPGLQIFSQLELRKNKWEVQQEIQRSRDSLITKLEPLQEESARLAEEKNKIWIAMEALLAEGSAGDGEGFLRRGAAFARREELTRSIRQLELSMFSGWEEHRKMSLLHVLEHHDAASLDQAAGEAESEMKLAEHRWNELQQKRGRLLQEKDSLLQLCQHDTALQQLEEQRAALKEIAGRYAVLSICAELITRTRRVYELEKQPQVLKLASSYFSRLTGGAYSRIVMKMGEKKLLAEHCDQGLMDSALLSRGTAEQLYLAMRFALAGSMNSKTSVPLLFDDIFVNFDEDRMLSALGIVGETSAHRQIIMLTCHRYVVEHIQSRLPHAQIIWI